MNRKQSEDQSEFFSALDLLEKEKGISKEYMLERVTTALASAFKKESGCEDANILVEADEKKGDFKVYQVMEVVEEVENEFTQISLEEANRLHSRRRYEIGSSVQIELKPKNFRRLSTQAAKQVIIQGIREAERGRMLREYEDKKEEIITATVTRVDEMTEAVMIDTGTSIVPLIKSEQIPGETFREGDKIKVFVIKVNNEQRGPIVTVSRTHPGLVKRLFELEIPEIQDGTVVIRNISREAGSRTKMSVESRDPAVDPTGACIGSHSVRINSVLRELHGERIDIIKYSDDPAEYIKASLSPAKVEEVTILEGEQRSCRVIVANDQLSLAIGKEGQNARLAARLTGYKIDIKTRESLSASEFLA